MNEDTARRERAEEWANERGPRGKRRSSERALWQEAVMSYMAGEQDEAARAAEKLREAARLARDGRPLSPVTLDVLADEIEKGR